MTQDFAANATTVISALMLVMALEFLTARRNGHADRERIEVMYRQDATMILTAFKSGTPLSSTEEERVAQRLKQRTERLRWLHRATLELAAVWGWAAVTQFWGVFRIFQWTALKHPYADGATGSDLVFLLHVCFITGTGYLFFAASVRLKAERKISRWGREFQRAADLGMNDVDEANDLYRRWKASRSNQPSTAPTPAPSPSSNSPEQTPSE